MTAPVTINYIVSLQIEGGAVSPDHVRRSLEFAIQHYRDAEGLSADADDGSVTEFQVQPEFLTLALAQSTDPLTLRLAQQLENLESGSTLAHYAAQAALAVLASNWSDAGAVYNGDAEEASRLLTLYAKEADELPNAIAITAHEAVRMLQEGARLMQMADEGQGDYAAALHDAATQADLAAKGAMRACLQAILSSPGANAENINASSAAERLREGTATKTLMESILQAAKTGKDGAPPTVNLNNLPPV
ncbi:hypothetical protein MARCHEWKA_01370 [Brevundimonas phage vB_BpoS-Marchewka]|uniref:Uncharacterized protein n=1 Tax=Brevundimonas phage vB_BpoS-Marchewka TaxID=2948604 RepID=A0A9E7N419_9CAUD|nr:hypothetical protein MARCHEWKA_01370 [Brevundimonas phage vB_BpoS-Marchewka]